MAPMKFTPFKCGKVIKSQNTLSWKGPPRIIESIPWLHTAPPKNQTLCLRALYKCSLTSGRLGAMPTALGSLCQCPTTPGCRTFP